MENWNGDSSVQEGIKSDRINYRPLTMLNLNSKILESVACYSLDNHLSEEEILHPNQWGFKKKGHFDRIIVVKSH